MLPGAPKHTEIKQLGEAHTLLAHKEDCFIREVIRIGEILPLRLQTFFLRSIQKQQHCVPIKVVADYLLEFHPAKLLPGFSTGNIKAVEKNLSDFWPAYRQYNANHPVFNDHQNKLHRCLPCKLHSDEGTGLRKSAVMQYSWGGVLTDAPNSFDRYFFWCSLLGEEYKKAHAGYEAGNVVLDEVCEELARQCQETYLNGVQSAKLDCVFFLVWLGLEGDLPAQARAFRLKRNFGCSPNKMCPWCEADDISLPFSDNTETAQWKATVHQTRPWSTRSPLSQIAGAETELFLVKDLFHLCHLGAARGFAVNVLCYLVTLNLFVSCNVTIQYVVLFFFCF